MEQASLVFFLLGLFFCAEIIAAREIDHLVVKEKIDRVGSLQNGGSGKKLQKEKL